MIKPASAMAAKSCKAAESLSLSQGSADLLHRRLPYVLAALLQLVGMAFIGFVITSPVPILWPVLQAVLDRHGLWAALVAFAAFYHIAGLAMCLMVVLLRELTFLVVRPGPGRCEVNSLMYISWWFTSRLVSVTYPIYMSHMRGTVVHTWWLRALGARIGRGARLARGLMITDPDMTIINDNSVLGKCRLVGSIVRDGMLIRDYVEVGPRARVGTQAVMQPGSKLAEGAVLSPLSVAAEGQELLPAHGVFEGAPASFVHPRSTLVAQPSGDARQLPLLLTLLIALLQAVWGPLMAVLASRATFPMVTAIMYHCHILDFLVWHLFNEGVLMGAIYTSLGLVPMLGIAILKASWTIREYVYRFPDDIIEHVLKVWNLTGAPVTVQQFRAMFDSPEWLEAIRKNLPAGFQMVGKAGDPHLMMVAPGDVVSGYHDSARTFTLWYPLLSQYPTDAVCSRMRNVGWQLHGPDRSGHPRGYRVLCGGRHVGVCAGLHSARPPRDGHGHRVLPRAAPLHAQHDASPGQRHQGAAARAQGEGSHAHFYSPLCASPSGLPYVSVSYLQGGQTFFLNLTPVDCS
jgi:acetyltransferase-like isoleucine patch superfamily enzyme